MPETVGVQPYTLTTEPWHLRPWRTSDIDQLTVICQDPLIQRWTSAVPIPYTRADAEFLVSELAPKGWADGSELFWAISPPPAHPAADQVLGAISLRIREGSGGDVGYWLAPAGRGRGVATRAVADVCREGFRLGLDVIRWEALAGNEASRRVAERVGFRTSGPVPRLLHHRGQWRDGLVGTLLAPDEPVPPSPTLCDGVVTLRPWTDADLPHLAALVDDAVLRFTGVPGDPQRREAWLDRTRRPHRPPSATFAITGPDGGLAGGLRLHEEEFTGATILGWWLGPAARGRGLAERALRLALPWSVSHGAVRFVAGIFDGNTASRRLAERVGMQPEGLRRAHWPAREPGGQRLDTWLYALVPADPGWPRVPQVREVVEAG